MSGHGRKNTEASIFVGVQGVRHVCSHVVLMLKRKAEAYAGAEDRVAGEKDRRCLALLRTGARQTER